MATTTQLTQMLRDAHIVSLKQSYLNLIEEARQRKEQTERTYHAAANQAYVDKMQGFKDRPQQLRSLGLGGGRGQEEMRAVVATYEDTMAKLQRGMSDSLRDFEYTVQKQTQLMNNALNEYNARISLEDYNKSAKSSSSRSGSSSEVKLESYVPAESGVIVPGEPELVAYGSAPTPQGRRALY